MIRAKGKSMSEGKSGPSSLKTVATFLNGRACSDTLFHVLNQAYGHSLPEEERAAAHLAGGIVQHGYQCGMVWGAALAAGAQSYRLFGRGAHAETKALLASQRLVDSFQKLNNNINCLEITELNQSSSTMQLITYFLIKGGTIGCFRMAAKYAPVAYHEINIALSEESTKAPSDPVSCSSVLAQKLGASDLHTVMAAGLAGGIGLSGGACGALGAAIWIHGMNSVKEGSKKIPFKAPILLNLIDRFLKCTDYEFECSKIVGRPFNSIEEHASHVCSGGCSKIIEALAAPSTTE
jgi:C_GCAxxG_C_C family probable redox protein